MLMTLSNVGVADLLDYGAKGSKYCYESYMGSTINNVGNRVEAFIYEGVRTPRGSVRQGGSLTETSALDMVGGLLQAMQSRTKALEVVEDMTLGCVTQKGEQGGNVARTALLSSGLAATASASVINSFCCSGLDAARSAALKSTDNTQGLYLAGGVESMSRVMPFSDKGPYYTDPAVMAKAAFTPMWLSADYVATVYGTSREAADAYAVESQKRAAVALAEGRFQGSLVAQGAADIDEAVRGDVSAEKLAGLPTLKEKMGWPAPHNRFFSDFPQYSEVAHIHSAGSAPALTDAASLLLIGSREAGERQGLKPRARIVAADTATASPVLSLTGGIEAARKVMKRADKNAANIDLVEFNEAYSAVCLLCMDELGIDHARFNVNGGAIALGHPMGATGGILLITLMDELERRGLRTGLVAVSGAAGLGSAMIIERI